MSYWINRVVFVVGFLVLFCFSASTLLIFYFWLFSTPLFLKCYMCTEAAKQALDRNRVPCTRTLFGISVLNYSLTHLAFSSSCSDFTSSLPLEPVLWSWASPGLASLALVLYFFPQSLPCRYSDHKPAGWPILALHSPWKQYYSPGPFCPMSRTWARHKVDKPYGILPTISLTFHSLFHSLLYCFISSHGWIFQNLMYSKPYVFGCKRYCCSLWS